MLLSDFTDPITENQMSDILFASGLIHNAIQESKEKPEYFDFITHLSQKFGKKYSTDVHQSATKLAEQAIKESN